jgi:type 1 fimbria pilin
MRLFEAHHMKLLYTPNLLRAPLVWVLLGALTLVFPLLAKAQTNDEGAVVFNGQIYNGTCVLRVAESLSVNVPNDYTMRLGTVPVATADSAAVGSTFGTAKTVYFYSAANATLGPSTCSGGQAFDVGLTIPLDKTMTIGTQTLLLSNGTVAGGAAGGVALSLKSKNATFNLGNFVGDTDLDLINGSPFGVLLSGKKNLTEDIGGSGNNRVYALTAQFVKTSATVTAGAYSTTIAFNIWWR